MGTRLARTLPWALLLAGSAAALMLYVRQSAETSRRIATLSSELAELKQRHEDRPIFTREAPTRVFEQDPNSEEPHPESWPNSETEEERASAPVDREARAREADERISRYDETRRKLLHDEYEGESEDRAWSQEATARIQALYSAPEFQSLRVTAACKSTLCRVDFSYADAESGLDAVEKLGATQPWRGRRVTHVDLEQRSGTSYIAREDFDLPSPDPSLLGF